MASATVPPGRPAEAVALDSTSAARGGRTGDDFRVAVATRIAPMGDQARRNFPTQTLLCRDCWKVSDGTRTRGRRDHNPGN